MIIDYDGYNDHNDHDDHDHWWCHLSPLLHLLHHDALHPSICHKLWSFLRLKIECELNIKVFLIWPCRFCQSRYIVTFESPSFPFGVFSSKSPAPSGVSWSPGWQIRKLSGFKETFTYFDKFRNVNWKENLQNETYILLFTSNYESTLMTFNLKLQWSLRHNEREPWEDPFQLWACPGWWCQRSHLGASRPDQF